MISKKYKGKRESLTLLQCSKNCYGSGLKVSQVASTSVSRSSERGDQRSDSAPYPSHHMSYCLPQPCGHLSRIQSMKYSEVPSLVMIGLGHSSSCEGKSTASFS